MLPSGFWREAPANTHRKSKIAGDMLVAAFLGAFCGLGGNPTQSQAQGYVTKVGVALNPDRPDLKQHSGLDDNRLDENTISTAVQRLPFPHPAVPWTPHEPYTRVVPFSRILGRDIPHDTPAFFRDTLLHVVPRTYLLSRDNFDGTVSEAMATGGWIAYRSGLIGGVLGVQAAFYTSQKIFGERDESGTELLTPDQDPINVLGQALVRARLFEQEFLGGRQLIDTPLINQDDSRMVPLTFEAVTANSILHKNQHFDYAAGFIWQVKPRDSNDFIPMSEALTNPDVEDEGAPFAMIKYRPFDGLSTIFMDYYVKDFINSGFAQVEYIPPEQKDHFFGWGVGANINPQQSTGADLLTGTSFSTYQASAKVQARFGGFHMFVAGSANGDDADIVSPFGSQPNYTNMQQLSFDSAGEKALGGALIYDFQYEFGKLWGFTVGTWYTAGWDAIDPITHADLADRQELDFWIQYRPVEGPYEGLRAKIQYANVWQDGNVRDTQPEFRAVVDYTMMLKN